MSGRPVEEYFATLDASSRAAFEHIRAVAVQVAPDAVEGTTYGMAALMLGRKGLLAFLATARHLSIFPCSGSVVAEVRDRLDGYSLSKGTIRFHADRLPPDDVVRDIVRLRRAEIET